MKRYPRAELDPLWNLLLLNQLHDIIPGSSVHQVYLDSQAQYREIENRTSELLKRAAQLLFTPDMHALAIVNTTG